MNLQKLQSIIRVAILGLIFLLPAFGMAQWQQVKLPSTTYNLQTASSNHAIYAYESHKPKLFRTTNKVDWDELQIPIGLEQIARVVTSEDTLVIIERTSSGMFAHFSFNLGQTWSITNSVPGSGLYASYIYANGRLIAETGLLEYHYTDDFGATWKARYVGFIPDWSLGKVIQHNTFLYFASSENQKVYRSINNGFTWGELPLISVPQFFKMERIQSVGGILYLLIVHSFTGESIWVKSIDNGLTWADFNVNVLYSSGFLFQEGDRIFITLGPAYPTAHAYYTDDFGNTWVDMGKSVYQLGKGLITDGLLFSTTSGDTWEVGGYGLDNWWYYNGKRYATSHHLAFSGEKNHFRLNEIMNKWEIKEERNYLALGNESENDVVIDFNGGLNFSTDAGNHWTYGGQLFLPEPAILYENNIYWGRDSYLTISQDFGKSTFLANIPFLTYATLKVDSQVVAITNGGIYTANKSAPVDFQLSSKPLSPILNHRDSYFSADSTLMSIDDAHLYVLKNDNWIAANLNIDTAGMPSFYGGMAGAINGQYYLILDVLTQTPERKNRVFHSSNQGLDWNEITSEFPNLKNPKFIESNFALYLHDRNKLFRINKPVPSISLVSGLVYFDENQNGIKEASEQGIPSQVLKTKQASLYSTTDQNGFFAIGYDGVSTDTIQALLKPYQFVTSAEAIINSNASSGLEVGIFTVPGICDLKIEMENIAQIRPGFNTEFHITLTNSGTMPSGGIVQFVLNPEFELSSTSISPQMQIADTLYFELPSLQVGEVRTISIYMKTKVQVTIGDYVSITASVGTACADFNILDNYVTLRRQIVGSYDPNDKSVSDDCINPDFVQQNKLLYYTIRFQNTGNFPASFVRIADTLQQNLQVGSIQIVAASHPFTWTLKNRNILDFFFDNINLPDSTSNEPESHGYVKFAIKADSTIQLGTKIENKALIYFDYNLPITTNTVKSEVKLVSAKDIKHYGPHFSITPNPGMNDFILHPTEPVFEPVFIQIFDVNGRMNLQQSYDNFTDSKMLPDWHAAPGVYFIQIKTGSSVKTYRLVVQF